MYSSRKPRILEQQKSKSSLVEDTEGIFLMKKADDDSQGNQGAIFTKLFASRRYSLCL